MLLCHFLEGPHARAQGSLSVHFLGAYAHGWSLHTDWTQWGPPPGGMSPRTLNAGRWAVGQSCWPSPGWEGALEPGWSWTRSLQGRRHRHLEDSAGQGSCLGWEMHLSKARVQHGPPPIPAAAHILPDSEAGLPSPGTTSKSLTKAAHLLDQNSTKKGAASNFRGEIGN